MKRIVSVYIVAMLIGLFMVITSIGDCMNLVKNEPAEFSTKTLENFKEGEMVEGNVQYVFDVVATLETSKTMYGVPYHKEETPYYLVMVTDKDDIIQGYVVMHITNKNNITQFDKLSLSTYKLMTDENYNGDLPDPVKVQTKTQEMPKDLKKCVYDYFADGGMSKSECDELVSNYVLEQKNFETLKKMPIYGAAIMIVSTVIFLIILFAVKGRKKKVYVNEIPNFNAANPDFNATNNGNNYYSAPQNAASTSRYGDAYKEINKGVNSDDFLS